jgi:hypothetical protein
LESVGWFVQILKRSDTQYCFRVGLQQPEPEVCGVALLGHQTLAELHESISVWQNQNTDSAFFFRFRNAEFDVGTRIDNLNLRVGLAFEYIVDTLDETRHEIITVDFIDDE